MPISYPQCPSASGPKEVLGWHRRSFAFYVKASSLSETYTNPHHHHQVALKAWINHFIGKRLIFFQSLCQFFNAVGSFNNVWHQNVHQRQQVKEIIFLLTQQLWCCNLHLFPASCNFQCFSLHLLSCGRRGPGSSCHMSLGRDRVTQGQRQVDCSTGRKEAVTS